MSSFSFYLEWAKHFFGQVKRCGKGERLTEKGIKVMKEYVKPEIFVTTFTVNESVAANGCQHVDATDPTQTTVYCIIGNQQENVFTGSCQTKANEHAVIDHEGTEDDYFIWFTYAGDMGTGGAPDESVTAKLDALVEEADYTPGPGWHYAKVVADGTDAYDTLTIS